MIIFVFNRFQQSQLRPDNREGHVADGAVRRGAAAVGQPVTQEDPEVRIQGHGRCCSSRHYQVLKYGLR